MPLLDHFRPPLYPNRSWESFHARWSVTMSDHLNASLPGRVFSEVQCHVGPHIEADVAEFEMGPPELGENESNGTGGVAVRTEPYAPPTPAMVMPAIFPDDFEVKVFDTREGKTLVAVIELVSPGNKDRPDNRLSFAAKCLAYLRRGIGLSVIDIVTERGFNLHNELVELTGAGQRFRMPDGDDLYAVAYRPAHRLEANEIDVWPHDLTLGQSLPLL